MKLKYESELIDFKERSEVSQRKNVEFYFNGVLYSFSVEDVAAVERWNKTWLVVLFECSIDRDRINSNSDL